MNSEKHKWLLLTLLGAAAGAALAIVVPPTLALGATAVVAVSGVLVFRRQSLATYAPAVGRPTFRAAGHVASPREEQDFAKLVKELRGGPVLISADESPNGKNTEDSSEGVPDPLLEFFAWAPERLDVMRQRMEKTRNFESEATRRGALADIQTDIGELKRRASLPQLQPAWQLATALEGLLKQLASRTDIINQSSLRTVGGGLDLLVDLCAPGVRADLASNPVIKIMAVDDDAASRFTVSAAVRKAFDRPDLAECGKTALAQIEQLRYDLIILDVMMPEMNGFEVCGRIRETALNGSTPVLFVTALKDFDTRIRSLSPGASDLMGKPFISFEVAVKALTLVLRSRLHERDLVREATGVVSPTQASSVSWPTARAGAASEAVQAPPPDLDEVLERYREPEGAQRVALLPPHPFGAATFIGRREIALEISSTFLAYMEAFSREMNDQLKFIGMVTEGAARQELLIRFHLRLQSLSRTINFPELVPAFKLCCAIEGMCKKLTEHPQKATASALRTVGIGLDLLKDLCAPGVSAELADHPPMRILVVDDEPIARRALVMALQMAFPRPESADNGELALALTAGKEFDLIFLDIDMPGMDGFTACNRIHEQGANRTTPVVFVTSHSGDEFRAKAGKCGGRDFVAKPFDFMEIPVKAISYALLGRLEKSRSPEFQDAWRSA